LLEQVVPGKVQGMAKKQSKSAERPTFRDRIKEFRRVPATALRANPKNWRVHPESQRDVMSGILAEIGFAGAVLARETESGLELIDGHLRTDLAGDELIPVLILDVSAEEAIKLLAVFDPSSSMAKIDSAKLDSVLREVNFSSPAIQEMLSKLAETAGLIPSTGADEEEGDSEPGDSATDPSYQLVVELDDELQQETVYKRLKDQGFRVRMITV
jgi:hypothetical protein